MCVTRNRRAPSEDSHLEDSIPQLLNHGTTTSLMPSHGEEHFKQLPNQALVLCLSRPSLLHLPRSLAALQPPMGAWVGLCETLEFQHQSSNFFCPPLLAFHGQRERKELAGRPFLSVSTKRSSRDLVVAARIMIISEQRSVDEQKRYLHAFF